MIEHIIAILRESPDFLRLVAHGAGDVTLLNAARSMPSIAALQPDDDTLLRATDKLEDAE